MNLTTACHYCNQTFLPIPNDFSLDITNYISLIAESLGMKREDNYKKYIIWSDLGRIMEDIRHRIPTSPFSEKQIIKAIKNVIANISLKQ